MNTMSFVAADLGASGIRCTKENGKINVLPNNMVIIPNGEVTELEPNSEEIENNLEFTITKKEPSDMFPVTCLYGKMAERYSPSQLRPSVMAVASFFFNMSGVVREEHKQFMSGQVLSLDIGASTSDLAIIKDGKFLDMTGKTYKTGGNIARAELINLVRESYDYELPIPDAERTIAEGRLQSGNGFIDASDMVTEAKQKLARSIVEHMMTYFSEVNIPIHTIRGIVVSGGGSMAGKYITDDGEEVKTSEPLSYFVTEELQNICKTVDVLPYGEDARYANIKGLFIRAKLLMAKKSAAIAKAQAEMAQAQVEMVQPTQTQVPVQPVAQNTPPSVPQI